MPKSQETPENFPIGEVRAHLEARRCVAVIGPAGAGKTTCVREAVPDATFVSLFGARDELEGLFRVGRVLKMAELPGATDEAIERIGRLLSGLGPTTLVLDHADAIAAVAFWSTRWLDAAPELSLVTTHRERRQAGLAPVVALDAAAHPTPVEVSEPVLWLAILGRIHSDQLVRLVDPAQIEPWRTDGGFEMPDPVRETLLGTVDATACERLCLRLAEEFDATWSAMADAQGLQDALVWWEHCRVAARMAARAWPASVAHLAGVYAAMVKWGDVGLDDVATLRRALARQHPEGQGARDWLALACACIALDVELGFVGRARGLHVDVLMRMTRETPPPWLSRAMQVAGARLAMHVDAWAAVERFEDLVQTYRTLDRLESLLDLGSARLAAFRVADANDAFQAAMDAAEGLDPRFVIRARLGLAQVSWRMSYTERARAQFEIALTQLPDGPFAAQTAYDFGVVLHHLDELAEARRSFARASRIWSTIGDARRLAAYHIRRGVLELEAGDLDLARVQWLAAADNARQTGDAHLLSVARACTAVLDDAFDDKEFRAVEENVMVGRDPEAVMTFACIFGVKHDMERGRVAVDAVQKLLGLEDVALRNIADAALNLLRGDAPPLGALAPMFRALLRHVRKTDVPVSTARDLLIHPQAHWFTFNGTQVELIHRKPLRRILEALLHDWRSGGDGLSVDAVLAAGWPGELVEARSGANRVYATIRLLRKAGLEDAITTEEGVYRLDPALQIRVVDG